MRIVQLSVLLWLGPALSMAVPPPPLERAESMVRDASGNLWALAPGPREGTREIKVLPAQAPTAWITPQLNGIEPGRWTSLSPQLDRSIILTGEGKSRMSFDPRRPERAASTVTTMMTPPSDSPWRLVSRLPVSNHDITGAVLDGKLYIAGGLTSDFGFPASAKAFDRIQALNRADGTWSDVARLPSPRIYAATVAFNQKIWIVGGDIIEEGSRRVTTTAVHQFDPATGQVSLGPPLPFALPMPLALSAGGRLWVMGSRDRSERGRMASIAPGEATWRMEADALPHMWALAGSVHADDLYVMVPATGLCVFNPATLAWSRIPGPTQARSAQVATWGDEIWIMGGCDRQDWTETWIFHVVNRTWRRGPALPEPLAWGAAAVINDRMTVVGGAGIHGPQSERNYVFSDRTWELDRARAEATTRVEEAVVPPVASIPRWSDHALRGTGRSSLPFSSEQIFPQLKFGRLATILSIPGPAAPETERLLVAEVHGPVWTFPNRPDPGPPAKMFDLPTRFGASTHTYAIAFHPRYPAVPYLYVLYNRVEPKPAFDVLARFTVSAGEIPSVDWHTEEILLSWPSNGHNGGDVKFGPDGYLYFSAGDGGPPGDPHDMGQRTDVISGGVFRIDVERRDPGQNYAIPRDNPFVGIPNVRPEFWAYGLRNPWRMAFSASGDLWLADNGDDSWESVHLIRPGLNYGWSVFEGTHPFKRNRALGGPNPRLTPPIIELSHAEARSVIGGLVYQGNQYPTLQGQAIFGDWVYGTVWAFRWDGQAARDYRRIADVRGSVIAFGTDRAGRILMAREDGQIHQLVETAVAAKVANVFPRKLSETGLFAKVADQGPAPGVIPYEINAEIWSDGAVARRHMAIAGAQGISTDLENSDHWDLPTGTVLARTLEIPSPFGATRVETQIMYHDAGGWTFHTYAWNETQTDADLVDAAGEVRPVPGNPTRRWRFAARNECAICHTPATHSALGLSTAQLNRDGDLSIIGRKVENQVGALRELGLLRSDSTASAKIWPRRVAPADATASLDSRARSYLDINCAHCHRTGGVGGRAAFQLLESLPLPNTGMVNGTPLVPLLGEGSRLIVPGQPERSEIIHRFSLPEGGRMPLMGSEQIDPDGLKLLTDWVRTMAPKPVD